MKKETTELKERIAKMEQDHKREVEEVNKQLKEKDKTISKITKEKDQAIEDTKRIEGELRVSEEKAVQLKAQLKTLRMRLLVWSILLNHQSLQEGQLKIVSQMMLESREEVAKNQKSMQVKVEDQQQKVIAYLESCKIAF